MLQYLQHQFMLQRDATEAFLKVYYTNSSHQALCNVISEGYIAVHLGALLLAGLLT